ncbi:hypothetical protein CLAIMM_09692 [Cladophialophora immunda]|nr:hypothetical protein CLAIMM_09692 [Cladophialophora immunda]
MKAQPRDDQRVKDEFIDGFWGTVTTRFPFEDTRTDIPPTLQELAEWERLMRTIYRAQTSLKTDNAERVTRPSAEKSIDEVADILKDIKISLGPS